MSTPRTPTLSSIASAISGPLSAAQSRRHRGAGELVIEQRLKEIMDIPVVHGDQHGTAIIAAAGLLNPLDITGKSIREVKVAVSGAGSSALSVIGLIKAMGLPHENAIVCNSKGVLHKGRQLDQWRSAHAVETDKRTLAEAMDGADVFIGLSVSGAATQAMVKSMAKKPIIFAMANPTPEITPEEILAVRTDAIIATGRSDSVGVNMEAILASSCGGR